MSNRILEAANEAREDLLKVITPGDTVFTVLRHVSASGMSRRISLFIPALDREGKPTIQCIDWHVSRLLPHARRGDKDGLVVKGCGMDMGFHLVYGLGSRLWPYGTPAPHGIRNGAADRDGGYALIQRWL